LISIVIRYFYEFAGCSAVQKSTLNPFDACKNDSTLLF